MDIKEIIALANALKDGKLEVTLDGKVVDIKVVFKYTKIKGRITVVYVDENGVEIADRTVMENLELGTYKIEPKVIEGYKLAE